MSLQWTAAVLPDPRPFPPEVLPEVEPADEVIAEVAEQLAQLRNASAMNLALDVGHVVVTRLFRGDLERVRTRGRKDNSFRKLASHPRLPFSPMRLWRAVGAYELVSRMPGLPKAPNLSVSHLYVVLGLPHETQEWLLRAANEHAWSVALLEQKANKHRNRRTSPQGRAEAPVLRSLRELERLAGRLDISVEDDEPLDPEQVVRAKQFIDRIRAWCDELGHVLERQVSSETGERDSCCSEVLVPPTGKQTPRA
jgi:hypothetical protein